MIDHTKVNLSQLKSNRGFQQFLACLETALEEARETYESSTASDFNRGRVAVLKEIISDIKR